MRIFDWDQLPEPANLPLARLAMIGLEGAIIADDKELADECLAQVAEHGGIEFAEAVVAQFAASRGRG